MLPNSVSSVPQVRHSRDGLGRVCSDTGPPPLRDASPHMQCLLLKGHLGSPVMSLCEVSPISPLPSLYVSLHLFTVSPWVTSHLLTISFPVSPPGGVTFSWMLNHSCGFQTTALSRSLKSFWRLGWRDQLQDFCRTRRVWCSSLSNRSCIQKSKLSHSSKFSEQRVLLIPHPRSLLKLLLFGVLALNFET